VALWALLPLLAEQRLGLGAGGYGVLLGALGVGAVLGALVMPRVRTALSINQMLAVSGLVYAVALAVVAWVREPVVATVALIPAGAAWMTVLSNLNAELQLFLPGWVRARGLGTYQTVFFGGQALGALVWGVLADEVGLVPTTLAAAAIIALSALTVRLLPLLPTAHLNREPAAFWPDPQLSVEPDPEDGPVVVEVTYLVRPENEAAFLAMRPQLRRSRLRTGAVQWGLFRTGERSGELVEIYVVPTWDEHMRQHSGRMTGADEETEDRVRSLADRTPTVTHRLPATPR
jgi:MFS family permease